jgi:hypothetical protein
MLKNKFTRQAIAFLTISLASILLYPSAQAGFTVITWTLLGLAALAAILTLFTK